MNAPLLKLGLFGALVVGLSAPVAAQQVVQLPLNRDNEAEARTTIRGDEYVLYRFQGQDGQMASITVTTNNPSAGFNVYVPGRGPGDEALYNSETGGGMSYQGSLYMNGDHTISVFLNRAAARQGQSADISVSVSLSGGSGSSAGGGNPPLGELVPGDEFTATTIIPCSRSAQGPMEQCNAGVVREGNGSGFITVFWPDTGSRVIFYERNTPSRYDESQADGGARMNVESRPDGTYLVRIGDQRFELFDSLMTGG